MKISNSVIWEDTEAVFLASSKNTVYASLIINACYFIGAKQKEVGLKITQKVSAALYKVVANFVAVKTFKKFEHLFCRR